MSTTHGAECHSLAAAIETMRIYRQEPVVQTLWRQGSMLAEGIRKVVEDLNMEQYFLIKGRPCCLTYATLDEKHEPSQAFRTLFLQETMRRGLLMPSLVISYSHSDDDVHRTINGIAAALQVYRRALDEGIDRYLEGRPVKPVFRKFN
ncbi:MAG: glutamate-1-semialdehyde 2,1-aminomutase, partial [Limisphaerales bacterium]